MDQRLEMAQLTREVLLDFIQPVQLLTIDADQATGAVSGRFRSGPLLFEYKIKGEKVSYSPLGGTEKAATRAGEKDQGKALPKQPQARGDGSGPLQQLPPPAGPAIEAIARETWVRRGIAYLAALWRQDAARVDAYLASEVRMDGPGQKVCVVGYQCGATCIARSKVCVQEVQTNALKRLATLASPTAFGPGGGSKDPGDVRHAQLKTERLELGRQLMSRLEQQRPDGKGTYMANPDSQTFALIEDAEKKRQRIDQELNRLEGRPEGEKRWYNDEKELGLDRYMEPEDSTESPLPGRATYEAALIESELAKGKQGKTAIFMAGGPASGKTTLKNLKYGKGEGEFVTIDPDAIKFKLPEMLASVAMGIQKGAAISHEQSSRISKVVRDQARERGLNFIMDGTGAKADQYLKQMGMARNAGYTVDLLMMQIDPKEGTNRAMSRADRTGRFVPRSFIEHGYAAIPGNWQRLSAGADRATLYDSESNTELAAVINGRVVADAGAAYRQFMRRFPQSAG
jgi:predicted ABC-type ATPase